jgi:EmrB/QacA subfamily drug resistance transporter
VTDSPTTDAPDIDADTGANKWWPLAVLGAAQFLMVLDQSVMNVSISQLVEDFDTDVTSIQAAITLYALVMAMFMLTGGKLGDILGRRKAFGLGLSIYAVGSAITAVSWSVPVLIFGWSILEGIGAALVLPALVALISENYKGRDRVTAFGVIGGVAGAGIAVGPILGGWVTTNLTWRLVFVGEVLLVLVILAFIKRINENRSEDTPPRLDVVGAALSASGLGLIVYAVLSASTWGWLQPNNSPIEPMGFALTPFVIAAGALLLWAFRGWEAHREATGQDPLVDLALLKVPPLRSGLSTFLAQNTVLLGTFFVLPLYLQIVLGFDAFETGVRMLPVSVAMFLTSASGPKLAARWSPRAIVQAGFVTLVIALTVMLSTIEPELNGTLFTIGMALLGFGMGLIASQLGNVVQSSVGADDRSEAGGLQWTSQQLGSALGTALIGAIVISGLLSATLDNVQKDERVDSAVASAIATELDGNTSFVTTEAVEAVLDKTDLDDGTKTALVENYQDAQLEALRTGLFAAGAIALAALLLTGNLPSSPIHKDEEEEAASP